MKQTRWPAIALIASALISVASATLAQGQITEPEMPFECAPAPKPVVSLSIGSRYEKGSETRSEISDESNADVNRALEPVEDFINDLSGMANAAYLGEVDSAAKANCVMAWLNVWAEGDALTRLNSLNARLAVSPRLAGLALAFLQVEKIATPDPERDKQTIAWLGERADEVIEFFETEAGPLASTNNLRAWAALATASIGQISGDETVLAWARES